MNYLVSYYIPSMLGLKIFLNLNKEEKFTNKQLIFYYLLFLMFSNAISSVISCFLFGLNSKLEVSLSNFPMFSFKYILVSVVINFILSIIITIIKKDFSISLLVEKNEVKSKNK